MTVAVSVEIDVVTTVVAGSVAVSCVVKVVPGAVSSRNGSRRAARARPPLSSAKPRPTPATSATTIPRPEHPRRNAAAGRRRRRRRRRRRDHRLGRLTRRGRRGAVAQLVRLAQVALRRLRVTRARRRGRELLQRPDSDCRSPRERARRGHAEPASPTPRAPCDVEARLKRPDELEQTGEPSGLRSPLRETEDRGRILVEPPGGERAAPRERREVPEQPVSPRARVRSPELRADPPRTEYRRRSSRRTRPRRSRSSRSGITSSVRPRSASSSAESEACPTTASAARICVRQAAARAPASRRFRPRAGRPIRSHVDPRTLRRRADLWRGSATRSRRPRAARRPPRRARGRAAGTHRSDRARAQRVAPFRGVGLVASRTAASSSIVTSRCGLPSTARTTSARRSASLSSSSGIRPLPRRPRERDAALDLPELLEEVEHRAARQRMPRSWNAFLTFVAVPEP